MLKSPQKNNDEEVLIMILGEAFEAFVQASPISVELSQKVWKADLN